MVLNVAFVVPMVVLGIEGPHSGLALATACSAFLNAGLLFRGLRRDGVLTLQPGWSLLFLRVIIASVVMAALLFWGAGNLSNWLQWDLWERIGQLLLWVTLGAGAYFIVLMMVGVRLKELVVTKSE